MSGITPVKQKYFLLDRKPISKSKAYRMTVRFLGFKAAQKLVYEDW